MAPFVAPVSAESLPSESFPVPIVVPSNIALLNGPLLLGNLFGYGLFGILCTQVFIYYYRYPKDARWIKVLVWGIFFVDIIITIFGTVGVWDSLAAGWGDLSVLSPLDWPYIVLPILSAGVASAVHFAFSYRIWRFRKSMILPALIMTISLVSWAMATFCGIHSIQLGIIRLNELTPFVMVWLGGSSLCDVLITIAMVSALFRAGSKSAFKETKSLTSKLIRLTVETGLTTTVGALAELILFAIFPNNNMHFLPFFMLSKLYSNTLLATLNSRSTFAHGLNSTQSKTPSVNLWSNERPGPGVQVTTVTERYGEFRIGAEMKSPRRIGSAVYVDQKTPVSVPPLPVPPRPEQFKKYDETDGFVDV